MTVYSFLVSMVLKTYHVSHASVHGRVKQRLLYSIIAPALTMPVSYCRNCGDGQVLHYTREHIYKFPMYPYAHTKPDILLIF